MKTKVLTLVSCFIANFSFAQTAEPAMAKAKYTFSHVIDTNKPNQPYLEDMILIIGKNASWYTSDVRLNQLINFKKHVAEQIKNNGGTLNGASIASNRKRVTTETNYYTLSTKNKLITTEKLIQEYLVEEEIPKIDWKISKDTLSFSGLKCQKATATFKGRNWVAWFAPELPFSYGPWKLNGLPGLIVDAYDDKKEVLFKFAGFEAVNFKPVEKKYVNADERFLDTELMGNEIRIPEKAIKVSDAEFKRLKDARDADPYGFAKTQLAGTPMEGLLNVAKKAMGNNTGSSEKTIVNNPIELN